MFLLYFQRRGRRSTGEDLETIGDTGDLDTSEISPEKEKNWSRFMRVRGRGQGDREGTCLQKTSPEKKKKEKTAKERRMERKMMATSTMLCSLGRVSGEDRVREGRESRREDVRENIDSIP